MNIKSGIHATEPVGPRAGRLHRAADQAVRRSLYQVVEKEEKKAKMKEKLKVLSQRRGIPYTSGQNYNQV